MQLKKLSDQVIVITGASSGIGRATAKMAAQRGATVILTARSTSELASVVAGIEQAGGRAAHYAADVTRPQQIEAVAEYAQKQFGRIDTWVNNAGVSAYGPIERLGLDDMRQVMDVTFWGVVNGTRAALPLLERQGGALINIGSEVSSAPVPLQAPYVAAKHAVAGLAGSPVRCPSRERHVSGAPSRSLAQSDPAASKHVSTRSVERGDRALPPARLGAGWRAFCLHGALSEAQDAPRSTSLALMAAALALQTNRV